MKSFKFKRWESQVDGVKVSQTKSNKTHDQKVLSLWLWRMDHFMQYVLIHIMNWGHVMEESLRT